MDGFPRPRREPMDLEPQSISPRTGGGGHKPPTRLALARRRRLVRASKYVLPAMALFLMSAIAAWPEVSRTFENGRATFRRLATLQAGTGRMLSPRFRSRDGRDQPYTITADSAQQLAPGAPIHGVPVADKASGPGDRVKLFGPRGDITLGDGSWLQVRARTGMFLQHAQLLDLAGDTELYRADGTVLQSATATLDLHAGAGAGDDPTHAEGPFGTLDAQGFTVVDKGSLIQFAGPARLVLNGGK